jgi:hypothetical protein
MYDSFFVRIALSLISYEISVDICQITENRYRYKNGFQAYIKFKKTYFLEIYNFY